MDPITVEHDPAPAKLDVLDVYEWPVWTSEVAEFDWQYDVKEICYILAGQITVTPEGGAPVRLGAKDLVNFPAGMRCRWQVHAPVRKHYRRG